MPKYQCHKTVWALKIAEVQPGPLPENGDTPNHGVLVFSEDGYAPLQVPHEFVAKHQPQVGGYYVVYADGYKSYSPAKAFDEGYTIV